MECELEKLFFTPNKGKQKKQEKFRTSSISSWPLAFHFHYWPGGLGELLNFQLVQALGESVSFGREIVAVVCLISDHSTHPSLQALVYDILPSTTAVFSCAIGSKNCQLTSSFLLVLKTVVSLLQTTQIISDVCFITDHVAYASSNKKYPQKTHV